MAGIDNLLEVMGFEPDADAVEKQNCADEAANLIVNLISVLQNVSDKINKGHQFYQQEKTALLQVISEAKQSSN